jgi:hypothetical protein
MGDMASTHTTSPVFVVGIWRSGTSLLYSLLNQHPEISLLYEGDLLLLTPLFDGGRAKADWVERWEFWNSTPTRHGMDTDALPAVDVDIHSAAEASWRHYAGEASVIGEKSPSYYNSLGSLASQFPEARFIVIWRDLADTCRSIIKARESSSFFRKRGILHRAILGYRRLKQQCDALVEKRVAIHQLHYEDLIEDPTAVMTGICDFLKVPFDPRMTTLSGADRTPIYQGSHHDAVKATEIYRAKEEPEVLPQRVHAKIAAYISFWHDETAGKWPVNPAPRAGVAKVSATARAIDEILFRLLWSLDRLTVHIYCGVPITLLRWYRNVKSAMPKPESPITKSTRKQPLVSEGN